MPYIGFSNVSQQQYQVFENPDINGTKLKLDADGDTSITSDTDDQIDVEISGADDFRFTANSFNILSGSTLTIDSGATIANSGTATGFVAANPASADGDTLGTASLEWSDLYLADSSVIYFGADQDITLTHSPDAGLTTNGTFQATTITATTAVVPDASDGAALGTTSLEWSDLYLADGAVLGFGDDQDVTLTHVADAGLLLNSTMALQFNDASQYINAPSATVLDINATDEVEVNATLMDINANVEISGTATTTGVHTFTAVPVLPANSIDSAHYVDGSIDNAHIGDDQIDSEHYVDGSIDNAHIADNAIDSEHYADGSIDNAHIADDQIDSEHYADGSIDPAHLADDAVTLAKMASGTDGNLISYDTSGNPVAVATGSDGQVLTSAGAGAVCLFEDAAGGGAWTLLTTATASNSSTLVFTSSINSTYDAYVFIMTELVPAADNKDLKMRTSTDAGSSYDDGGSDYVYTAVNAENASFSYSAITSAGGSEFHLSNNGGSADGTTALNGQVILYKPSGTTKTEIHWKFGGGRADGTIDMINGVGYRDSAADVDAVQFYFSSSTNTTSGKIRMYGISNS